MANRPPPPALKVMRIAFDEARQDAFALHFQGDGLYHGAQAFADEDDPLDHGAGMQFRAHRDLVKQQDLVALPTEFKSPVHKDS